MSTMSTMHSSRGVSITDLDSIENSNYIKMLVNFTEGDELYVISYMYTYHMSAFGKGQVFEHKGEEIFSDDKSIFNFLVDLWKQVRHSDRELQWIRMDTYDVYGYKTVSETLYRK